MSKIDYTNEYHNLLNALVTNDSEIITKAANAMGLDYNPNIIKILVQLDEKYIVSGITSDYSVCVLRED